MYRFLLAVVLCCFATTAFAEQVTVEESFFLEQGNAGHNVTLSLAQFPSELGFLQGITIELTDVQFTWTDSGLTVFNNLPNPATFQYHGWNEIMVNIPDYPDFQEGISYGVDSQPLTLAHGEWGNINYNPAMDIEDPAAYMFTQSVSLDPIFIDTNLDFAIGVDSYSVMLVSDFFRMNLNRNGEHLSGPLTYVSDLLNIGEMVGNVRVTYDYSDEPPVVEDPPVVAHAPEPSSLFTAVVGGICTILGLYKRFKGI